MLQFLQKLIQWNQRLQRWVRIIPPAGYAFGFPSLIFLILAAQLPRVAGPDLWPSPDAIEYALLTDSLIHAQPPRLHLGALDYPSRYALVYPLCAAIPAKAIEWLTALQHKDYSYLSRLYWIALLFGLASVLLLVHVGGWLTGSRWGGMLAGLFWCTHPALLRWAGTNMSETLLLTLWLALLAALRPWLGWRSPGEFYARRGLLLRGAALGLLAGLLCVAKAPFLYWAIAAAGLLLLEARRSRQWGPLIACIGMGLLVAASELAWRAWAFGSPLANGYTYWHPEIYGSFLKTFNLRYLWRPMELPGVGNFSYYAQLLLAHRPDFFAPAYMLVSLLALGVLMLNFRIRFRPVPLPARTAWLLVGWVATMLLFCGLYFFQSERFPLLIVPLIDLLPAWLLVLMVREGLRAPTSMLRRFGWPAAAFIMGMMLFNRQLELRAMAGPLHGPQPAVARAQQLVPLLRELPPGAMLFTNYQLALVQRLRPDANPTRCGTLYQHPRADKFFNGHAFQILHAALTAVNTTSAEAWQTPLTALFDVQHNWTLSPEQSAALGPFYILLVQPEYYPTINQFWRKQLLPRLEPHVTLVPVRSAGDMTLYRAAPRPGA